MKIERDFMVRRGLALPQDARGARIKREVKERWDDDIKMERRDGARVSRYAAIADQQGYRRWHR